MHAGHYASLLPEPFRHQSTKVRIFLPQLILLDFHGTISERRWEERVIIPYLEQATSQYLIDNLSHNRTLQDCVPALRQESFDVSLKYRYEEAPLIEDESDELELAQLAKQVAQFVLWQMKSKKETTQTRTIQRLVWLDGFANKRILTPLYPDVKSSLERWRHQYKCKLYLTSSVESEALKLFMQNTNEGNVDSLLSGYLSSRSKGDKLISETYERFYETTVASDLASKSTNSGKQKSESLVKSPPKSPSSLSKSVNHKNSIQLGPTRSKSPSVSSSMSIETQPKPILFLTDSGQEAKAASSVKQESVYECVLVNRPGNKRIRSYYLSKFQYVDRLDDIQFV